MANNVIENNGLREKAAGIRIRGETNGLVFENNIIRDTRDASEQTQQIGILIVAKVGKVELLNNTITATTPVKDERLNPSGASQ